MYTPPATFHYPFEQAVKANKLSHIISSPSEQNATQKRSGTGGRRTLCHRWSEVIPTSHQHRTYTSTRKSTQSQRAPLHAYQRISVTRCLRRIRSLASECVVKGVIFTST
ncbi:hypothetical protein PI125_g23641 [Phytophthora idaei]|nr:hypothetical protein PI125_g23641 [Phytophthora idaei]